MITLASTAAHGIAPRTGLLPPAGRASGTDPATVNAPPDSRAQGGGRRARRGLSEMHSDAIAFEEAACSRRLRGDLGGLELCHLYIGGFDDYRIIG